MPKKVVCPYCGEDSGFDGTVYFNFNKTIRIDGEDSDGSLEYYIDIYNYDDIKPFAQVQGPYVCRSCHEICDSPDEFLVDMEYDEKAIAKTRAEDIFNDVIGPLTAELHPDGFHAGIQGRSERQNYVKTYAEELVNRHYDIIKELKQNYQIFDALEQIMTWENYHSEVEALRWASEEVSAW